MGRIQPTINNRIETDMPGTVAYTSKVIPLLHNNIDTDQIIPARFLKATDKENMADGLFCDWRYHSNGQPNPNFVLNQAQHQDSIILLAGDNFGCGSSREHAPWALVGWGIRVVISTSFADIFCNNALKNGLLPIVVEPDIHRKIVEMIEEAPDGEFHVDLDTQRVFLPDGSSFDFPIDPFAKKCLLNGLDQMGYIKSLEDQISAFETQRGITIIN